MTQLTAKPSGIATSSPSNGLTANAVNPHSPPKAAAIRLSPCDRFMMRATPYWSVSPMATSAYMPPSTAPAMMISIRRDMRAFPLPDTREGRGGGQMIATRSTPLCSLPALTEGRTPNLWLRQLSFAALLPGRFGHDRRARAVLLRRDAVEIVALPLADRPDALVVVVLELDLADDGVEGTGVDLLDHRLAVDLTDLLDRLLQHLKARIGHRARPAIRLLAHHRLVVLDVLLEARQVGVRAADAHNTLSARA